MNKQCKAFIFTGFAPPPCAVPPRCRILKPEGLAETANAT